MSADIDVTAPSRAQPDPALVSYTHLIYALHSASVLIGLTTAWFVVTAFVFGLPSIIAVIMNYMRRREASGTYLESHFRWQIQTFWSALLAAIAIWLISIPLMLVLVGFLTLTVLFALLGIWVIYRIARGWLRLRDGLPVG
jgi:uncharacterized membrane protein